jgi:hypothetical protein
MDKSSKPADLTKGSSKQNTPQLSERDLDKVTGGVKIGGTLKIGDIQGPTLRDGHDDEIEIHG